MFLRSSKDVSAKTKPLKDLIQVTSAELLLAEEKRQVLLSQIKATIALKTLQFDELCLPVIHNFANMCQQLPEAAHQYYSQLGGVLDFALNRTEAACNLLNQYLIRDSQGQLSDEQKLWQYALYSAAMVQGVGKLQIDYQVELYDNKGQFLKQWNPLLESLFSACGYYRYKFLQDTDMDFRRRLNLLLARDLMPPSGFAWIVSDPQVLAVWLALLNEDSQGAGTLGAILIRANAIAIQRYFNQYLLRAPGTSRAGGRYGRIGTFAVGAPESIEDRELRNGIEFIQWLTQSLESGRIHINKSPLFLVPGGMIMLWEEVFHQYMQKNPGVKSLQALLKSVLSLGLHHVGPEGNFESRVEQVNTQQIYNGILFEDFAVILPAEVKLHNLNTGKVITISAMELINHSVKKNN